MKTILKIAALLCIYFLSQTVSGQVWERITALPQTEFTALEIIDGTLYAASGKNLYTSSNSGATWTHSILTNQNDIRITCLKKYNGKIYAGTSKGIFSANVNAVHNIWNHDLQTENINSFTERENVLYASLEAFGILKFNGTGWIPFNVGLPTYSMSVTKMLNTYAGMIAIAGANGTFYRYDSSQNVWTEDYFSDNGMMPGVDFDDIVFVADKLYASRYNTIYRSDDFGVNWQEDKLGLITGQARTLYATADSLYSISMIGTNMTRLNKRNVLSAGTSWANDTEMLPFLTYAIRELGGILFIASAEGVFVHEGALGIPDTTKMKIAVYPNPSSGYFKIECDTAIESLAVYDITGRLVLSQENKHGIEGFELSTPGVYIIEMTAGMARVTEKIIVQL